MYHSCTRYQEFEEIRESLHITLTHRQSIREGDTVWIHTPKITMTWPEGRRVAQARVARVWNTWPRRDQFTQVLELTDWQELSADRTLTWLDQLVDDTHAPVKTA